MFYRELSADNRRLSTNECPIVWWHHFSRQLISAYSSSPDEQSLTTRSEDTNRLWKDKEISYGTAIFLIGISFLHDNQYSIDTLLVRGLVNVFYSDNHSRNTNCHFYEQVFQKCLEKRMLFWQPIKSFFFFYHDLSIVPNLWLCLIQANNSLLTEEVQALT